MSVKALKRQLMAAIAMVLVCAIALGSSTFAWFVNNNAVSASTAKVQAATAGGNLMIKPGYQKLDKQTGGATTASVDSGTAIQLYPISYNAGTWYAVDTWSTQSEGGATVATTYRDVTPDNDTPVGSITGAYSGMWTEGTATSRTAYLLGDYTVYASNGSYDLYLNPTNPITVTGTTTTGGLYNCLRVGIYVDGTMKVVYAPTVDDGMGNDKDTAKGWRMVKSSKDKTVPADYDVITAASNGVNVNDKGTTLTENNYCAVKNDADNTYTAPTSNGVKLASSISADGKEVRIYVWMEGTDQQCIVGTADGVSDTNTYSVTVNFAGVAAA